MRSEYFISVDGGGTQCRTRLTDKQGQVLASLNGGAANIYSDFTGAMIRATQLINDTLQQAGLPASARRQTVAVLGLAGANVQSVRQQAQQWPQDFAHWQVLSDVEIACLGAHRGQPGAVLITGTGSQGAFWDGSQFRCVGGWGLTLSDQGSGALLGKRALRLALQAHEGLVPSSPLLQALMAHFDHSPELLLRWATDATPAHWGQFSPQIFDYAGQQDPHGTALIDITAQEISLMVNHLTENGQHCVALMGGLAAAVHRWLAPAVQRQVVPAAGDALTGGLQLAFTWG
ncbi:BadF/BadG/BcrA/BcrD ATPase family protein [Pantoea sp. B65]|uniref:BadF/BadG/BcrA/BcrD ATPase family protein n=1 Tax=Pantoea sp. B65 TaxID=2813359 RepID=UPI0039B51110